MKPMSLNHRDYFFKLQANAKGTKLVTKHSPVNFLVYANATPKFSELRLINLAIEQFGELSENYRGISG